MRHDKHLQPTRYRTWLNLLVEAVTTYRDWLERSEVQKVLFCAQPGALVPAGVVDWCRQNLKNLKAIDVGRGVHYLQEDNPHFIGGELVRW